MGFFAAIGAALSSVVSSLCPVGMVLSALRVVGEIFTAIGKALGLVKEETEVEELGDKAYQCADQIKPEDYDSYADYVKAVEEFDGLDPEKSKSPEENARKGTELAIGALLEKFENMGIRHGDELCKILGSKTEFFTPQKTMELGKLISGDASVADCVVGYLSGAEKDITKAGKGRDALVSIEKLLNSSLSDVAARQAVKAQRN